MKRFLALPLVALLPSVASADEWEDEVFVFSPDDYIAATLAPGGFPAPFPAGIPTLDEATVQSGLLLAGKLRDESGAVIGFAVEQADVDFAGLVSHATWTLTIPGRGTLFLSQDEDLALLFQILGEMQAGGELERTYDPALTVVTTLAGTGTVIGGTGEFEDARGTFREVDEVHSLSLATGALAVTDRLEISLKSKD